MPKVAQTQKRKQAKLTTEQRQAAKARRNGVWDKIGAMRERNIADAEALAKEINK